MEKQFGKTHHKKIQLALFSQLGAVHKVGHVILDTIKLKEQKTSDRNALK